MKTEINNDFDNGLDLLIPTVKDRTSTLFTIVNELEKESDRGCALVAAAYLENEITALLLGFFVEQGKSATKELFDFNGPLGTFSSKIKIAFALGLISKETQISLDVIRRIRNDFAHLQDPLNFDVKEILQKIDNLLPSYKTSESAPREKFIKKVQALVAVIHLSLANTFNQKEL
ncbi:MltR family transcriptional regulator, partial [Nitratifractor sp.]|uniref:MltR family transcriptional regulator n=1 Tax=Nitratifractor sp. TaxID=2268144 RepID=UPI0025CCE94C